MRSSGKDPIDGAPKGSGLIRTLVQKAQARLGPQKHALIKDRIVDQLPQSATPR
jgi:hypothetical protein